MKYQRSRVRLQDYRRFVAVLLIVGTYLYLGAVHNIFIQPADDGTKLLGVSSLCLLTGVWFVYKYVQLNKSLHNE
ncbi:MAG TPA: YrhC family protein [Bacillota bacterium]|nr:YrhC family protein [Bacillota bacterium]